MIKALVAAIGIATVVFVNSAYADDDAFDRGFEQGYQAENPGSVTPLPPLPPLPEMGQSDFQAGIAAGAEQGIEDSGRHVNNDDNSDNDNDDNDHD